MKMRSISEWSDLFGARLSNCDGETLVSGFATDSRTVSKGDIFIAIKGNRTDGTSFAYDAVKRGAVAVLSEQELELPCLCVRNVVEALAKMAKTIRSEFTGRVVGITGSAGKTTTKELIAHVIGPIGKIARTPGNRNTEFTAPLLWAELDGDEAAVVVEMSMRGLGQIAHLTSFSMPEIALVTNIGISHLEQLGTIETVAQAKAEIFQSQKCRHSVLPADDPFFSYLNEWSRGRVVRFGENTDSDIRIVSYRAESFTESVVQFESKESGTTEAVEVVLPFAGRHLVQNCAAAMAVGRLFGMGLHQIKEQLESARLPAQRMQVMGLNGSTIVFDAYNASSSSFQALLATLKDVPRAGRTLIVAGQMNELGDHSRESHAKLGAALVETGADEVIFFGSEMEAAIDVCRMAGWQQDRAWMATSHEAIRRRLMQLQPGDVAVIKGSRGLELEHALPLVVIKEATSC